MCVCLGGLRFPLLLVVIGGGGSGGSGGGGGGGGGDMPVCMQHDCMCSNIITC